MIVHVPFAKPAAVLHGKQAIRIDQTLGVQSETLDFTPKIGGAILFVQLIEVHQAAFAANEPDTFHSLRRTSRNGIMHGLLQIRLYGIKQTRRWIHVDEHAIRHGIMQPFQILFDDPVGTDRHKAVKSATFGNHIVKIAEHGQFHTLLPSIAFECRTQISEIGITQRLIGFLVVKQGHLMRNHDAFGLHAVAKFLADLNDLATRLLADG